MLLYEGDDTQNFELSLDGVFLVRWVPVVDQFVQLETRPQKEQVVTGCTSLESSDRYCIRVVYPQFIGDAITEFRDLLPYALAVICVDARTVAGNCDDV